MPAPAPYSVTNTCDGARAALQVGRPPKPFSGYRPPEALRVMVTDRGFEPERIALEPAQGLIFECRAASRIVIELERPDQGGGDSGSATAR